jgi:hypothetical protein
MIKPNSSLIQAQIKPKETLFGLGSKFCEETGEQNGMKIRFKKIFISFIYLRIEVEGMGKVIPILEFK